MMIYDDVLLLISKIEYCWYRYDTMVFNIIKVLSKLYYIMLWIE